MKDREKSAHNSINNTWLWVAVLAMCIFSFGFKAYVRFGPPDYLFYGNAQTGQPKSDAITWYLHAVNLLEGRGVGDNIHQFNYRNFVPPGHPFLVAVLGVFVGASPNVLGWIVACILSLLPLVAFLWGREMWGSRTGFWMALLASIHPAYTHTAFSLMAEPTAVITMAITLWCSARAIRRVRWNETVLAGLMFGLTGLIRPAVMAFIWGVLIGLLLRKTIPLPKRCAHILLWLFMALLPQMLWQARNYMVHDEASLVYSSISARHVWTGAHPNYGPNFYSRGSWHETIWRDPFVSEIAYIKRMQDEAQDWIAANRYQFVMSCIMRLNGLLPELKQSDAVIKLTQAGWRDFYLRAFLLLALAGLVPALRTCSVSRTNGKAVTIPGSLWTIGLLLGLFVSIWGAGVYGATYRYRWPLELVGLPFAAIFLDRLTRFASKPLYGFMVESPDSSGPPVWLLRLARYFLVSVAGLLVTGTAVIAYRQLQPVAIEETVDVMSPDERKQWIAEQSLDDAWSAQEPMWITYDDVFNEQASNYGALTTLNGFWVAWWGTLRLVDAAGGNFSSAELVIEQRAGELGSARLPIKRHPERKQLIGNWRDGQVVSILGRLNYANRSMSTPSILVYDIRSGRF
jgi:hypothetical protein